MKADTQAKYPQLSRINAEAFVEVQENGERAVVIRLGLVDDKQEEMLANAVRLGEYKIDTFTKMTNRERQCSELVMQGKCAKEIAAALNLGVRTVKFHLSNVYAKYGVSGRIELAILFLKKARETAALGGVELPLPLPTLPGRPTPHSRQ